MTYNWDGDCIIQDCAVTAKRYVIGDETTPIRTDIRAFVSPADDAIIKDILAELTQTQGLPSTKAPGDFDKRAMVIWDYVVRKIKYVYDIQKQGKPDFWLFPSEVRVLRKGDCEDASFLLASLLLGSGISPFNVRVVLGELLDQRGQSLGGHCWPMYKNEIGNWCILESTFDRAPWSMPVAERFTESSDVRYVPHFCFNNHHLWEIYHGSEKPTNMDEYLRGRKKLIKINNPRFPSGGYISAVMGDNSPGHLELTRTVMTSMRFSDDSISIATDAAQDPDFYDWETCSAHAQTNYGPDCRPSESEEVATSNYLGWIKRHLDSLRQPQTSSRNALFFLGYILHGVQDLACHRGITNPHHSYESYEDPGKDKDCDHLEDNRQIAMRYSLRFLKKLRSNEKGLFDKMRSYEGESLLFDARVLTEEKCQLLGKPGWDFSLISFYDYYKLASKYSKIKNTVAFKKWEIDGVFKKVLGLFQ